MTGKKQKRVPKTGAIWHRTAEQATLDRMPKYNAYACGTGAHGDAKYNRAKQKRAWQKETDWQEARTRGPLPFSHANSLAETRSSGSEGIKRAEPSSSPALPGQQLVPCLGHD